MSDEGKLAMRSVVIVKKREPSWRWITIDATGQREELAVEKYEIISSVQIHARDLRILDPNLCYPSTILVRERAIVINLEYIKAIITANKVYLSNSAQNLNPIVEELQRCLNVDIRKHHGQGDEKQESSAEFDDDGSPFEFRVLEVALEAICRFLSDETVNLEYAIYPALDALMNKINIRELNKLRKHKSTLNTLSSRVQKVRDELEKLLGDDGGMAELYLSRKLAGASSSPEIIAKNISRAKSHLGNVQDIEMLLEAYFIQIDSTLNNLTGVRNYFSDAEDYINVQLDTSRNELIKFELFLSTGSICISVYALVCGILGMNIPFSWNHKDYMFKWVVGVTATLCGVLFVIIMSYARYKRLVGI